MRKLKLIGIGAGNPDYITMQAVNALQQVDVVFVTDKGGGKRDLLRVRAELCERHMRTRPYRIVEMQDPERDREATAYGASVAAWHERRATLYEQVLRHELSDGQCGAFLVWGDPCLYDSTLRIVGRLAERGNLAIDFEVIPGITSAQALAAGHRISLNEVGDPIRVTTGRRLNDRDFDEDASVVVLLDGKCAFKRLEGDDIDIYWGAYLGTPDEILLSGKLSALRERIEEIRNLERQRKGWIMDIYLLRRRDASSK